MAFRPELRSVRDSSASPECSAMPAARRLIAPRARAPTMTPKLSTAVARNTSSPSIMLELSPNVSTRASSTVIPPTLDLEIHQPIHDEVPNPHPAAGKRQSRLGHAFVPDAGVEVGGNDLDDDEHGNRERG